MKEEIRRFIADARDEKYAEFQCKLSPNTPKSEIMGVRMPVLRSYAKQLNKNGLTRLGYKPEYYEEKLLDGMLIGLTKVTDSAVFKKTIISYLPYITDWAVCDIFCGGLKQTKKFADEILELPTALVRSEAEFEVRFAAVMLLTYYLDKKYIDNTLMLLKEAKHDGYYAKMAVAWAVSVAFTKDYSKTLLFLKTSGLDKFTHNKAIQKARESYRLTDEQKEELKRYRQ